MPSDRTSLSPLAALGIGVLLIAIAAVLGRLLYAAGTDQFGGPGVAEMASPTALTFARGALFGTITLGGVYAALTLERFDRPLLVVATIVFDVTFLIVAAMNFLSGSFGAMRQVSSALSTALYQAALVTAVTLVVRAIGVDASDAPTPSELLAR